LPEHSIVHVATVGGDEKLTILIIDDDDLIVEGASEYLKRHGYDIHTERQFGSAKSVMLKRNFDMVLLDLNLTGGHTSEGMEMVRWIRDQFPSTNIGVFTGSADGLERTARHLGVSVCLNKPTTVRKVLAAVNALDASRAESSLNPVSGRRV
jgi:two-component system OmpR family response regulator